MADSGLYGLTSDQHSQLLLLLKQTNISPTTSNPECLMASANFAGKLLAESFMFKSCMLSQVHSFLWIIDSGASDHMTSHKDLLSNIQALPIPVLVSLPNGYKVKVTNKGFLTLFPHITLHNVLYIPSFHYNLISVQKLVDQLDGIVYFAKTLCALQAPSQKMPLVLGKVDNGLYKLLLLPTISSKHTISTCIPSVVSPSFHSNPSAYSDVSPSSDTSVNVIDVVSNKLNKVNDTYMGFVISVSFDTSTRVTDVVFDKLHSINKIDILWHYRLGNIPFSRMKIFQYFSLFYLINNPFFVLFVHWQGKPGCLPNNSIQSTAPFQLIHLHTWGPYYSPTHNESKYFFTIVDDFSKATWTHLMGAKSSAFELLKAFVNMVETQFNSKVLTVRSDNAFKLGSSSTGIAFFSDKGVIYQTTCPHTPQQNGVVERKHKHLLETAKALLFQSSLPIKF